MSSMSTEKEVFEISAKHIHEKRALDFLIEECAELIVAASHKTRKRISRKEFIKELVDVENMIGQIKEFKECFDIEEYTRIKNAELERLFTRHSC